MPWSLSHKENEGGEGATEEYELRGERVLHLDGVGVALLGHQACRHQVV